MHASPEQTPEQPERLRLALLAVALLIALFIVGLVLGGVPEPGRGSTVERATVFDPQIGALLADYGPEMAKVRPGITVESADGSFTVRDCAGYIAMSGRPDRLKQLTGHPLSG